MVRITPQHGLDSSHIRPDELLTNNEDRGRRVRLHGPIRVVLVIEEQVVGWALGSAALDRIPGKGRAINVNVNVLVVVMLPSWHDARNSQRLGHIIDGWETSLEEVLAPLVAVRILLLEIACGTGSVRQAISGMHVLEPTHDAADGVADADHEDRRILDAQFGAHGVAVHVRRHMLRQFRLACFELLQASSPLALALTEIADHPEPPFDRLTSRLADVHECDF
mmetsp:Transcript_2338/g.6121  ORF Transcript_2338/g.6121 Transcript_2338/m.6121 type:complete len:223 (+) Transcript_2338:1783-2451(+)